MQGQPKRRRQGRSWLEHNSRAVRRVGLQWLMGWPWSGSGSWSPVAVVLIELLPSVRRQLKRLLLARQAPVLTAVTSFTFATTRCVADCERRPHRPLSAACCDRLKRRGGEGGRLRGVQL